ncbi:MurR/RpiR family transcriptional regulator [Sediminispirochaeta bajacaliforniensis]|uniref:MurR/RpiR family transcriptional regulator n=1 Tax=Sediminispirochaeta bajacaliforniensis TaxID=148 RepID=UPI00037E3587|nr:MurR/RpiR family transcriptional regulator [Sediminispirochaeta bajacaliforniensis]
MLEISCIYLIKSKYKEFSEKERLIADYILANPREAVHPSIEELAESVGISESTLVRFVKKLGYPGYQRFRIALATETVVPASRLFETQINENDDDVEVVFNSAISTLELSRNTLDRKAMTEAADLITSSERLYLFGTGGSNIVARDAFHKFIRTGLDCAMAEDYHMQLMLASQSCERCAALIISHTGENMDTLAIVEELKHSGCRTIMLTSNPRSPLARAGQISLSVQIASTSFVSEAFSARIAHLVVIDALYVEIMKRFDEAGVTHLEAMRQAIAKRRT